MFSLQLDICHAGSCIDESNKWIKENNQNVDYYLELFIYLLHKPINKCCNHIQGSTWVNHFIARKVAEEDPLNSSFSSNICQHVSYTKIKEDLEFKELIEEFPEYS